MSAKISDEAVQKATGKNWHQWFTTLDKANAANMTHKEIVSLLRNKYNVSMWWEQMLAVEYEQSRGLRKKHEKPQGFEISKNKTINADISLLTKSWLDTRLRKKWLGDYKITNRRNSVKNTLRFTWNESGTIISVAFYEKGNSKTQVSVQHYKLKDSREAERTKKFWEEKLTNLENYFKAK